MRVTRHRIGAALLAAVCQIGAGQAQDRPAPSWPETKCARYTQDWTRALAGSGRNGIGEAFIRSNEAFIASGCTAQGAVCPRSPEEIALANTLTVLAMNWGAASTFLPFGCRN